ncbi:MAG: DHHA1 domain-containing protein, partial [Candidatus Omnitrophica bacterium]|nr:DHHA1 domain-containing protein [Candidatus Omnitrophota bacterium]
LQAALRNVLGDHVKQSGSLVTDERLRFDFTHLKKMSETELSKVEEMVNMWVEEGVPVAKEVKDIKEAKAEGALSFFGEKYGEKVRVVKVGDKSKEFCGGSHVDNTSEIGLVKIISESSVASGIRRIEALTGDRARLWIRDTVKTLVSDCLEAARRAGKDISDILPKEALETAEGKRAVDRETVKAFEQDIRPGLLKIKEELDKACRKAEKEKAAGAFSEMSAKLDGIAASAVKLGRVSFASAVLEGMDMNLLRKAADRVRAKADNAVVILGGRDGAKAFLICAVSPGAVNAGIDARAVVGAAAGEIDGTGGGKPDFAQAGGKNPSGLEKAIEMGRSFVERSSGD